MPRKAYVQSATRLVAITLIAFSLQACDVTNSTDSGSFLKEEVGYTANEEREDEVGRTSGVYIEDPSAVAPCAVEMRGAGGSSVEVDAEGVAACVPSDFLEPDVRVPNIYFGGYKHHFGSTVYVYAENQSEVSIGWRAEIEDCRENYDCEIRYYVDGNEIFMYEQDNNNRCGNLYPQVDTFCDERAAVMGLGHHTLKVHAKNKYFGISAWDSQTFDIHVLSGIPSLGVSISGPSGIVGFTSHTWNVSNCNGSYDYQWYTGFTPTGPWNMMNGGDSCSITRTFSPGTYYLRVEATDGTLSGAATKQVNVAWP